MIDLSDKLEAIARVPVLLVATDYDGTLSPIVDDPAMAVPDRESIVALRLLAACAHTHVAIISGRSLEDLGKLTGEPEGVHLIGSHGSEFEPGFAEALPQQAVDLRESIQSELASIAAGETGFRIEAKPASVAFHYREADPSAAEVAVAKVRSGPGTREGVQVKEGKMVIELGVVPTDKGQALTTLRHRLGATATTFLGDDVTDEDAFAVLTGPDLGVKVGDGATRALFRVPETKDVAKLLARLAALRQDWDAGSDAVPIEEHVFLSDQRTCALATESGRITFMCAPRADSPAVFSELLGGPTAGYFDIRPAGDGVPHEAGQRYQRESLITETSFGGMTVTDYLDCSGSRPTQRAGRTDLVRVISGLGEAHIEFAPRLDFGRVDTGLAVRDDGLAVLGVPDPMVLRAPGVDWTIRNDGRHQTAVGRVELVGKPVVLELRFGTGDLSASVPPEQERRKATERYWGKWLAGLEIPDVVPELVRRSALVLRGLCHGPTGAILAAGTTSLPEEIGGVRNWDYRYCWLRDAAITAEALVRLGSNGEAIAYLDWLLGVLDNTPAPEQLRPLYSVAGAELGPEGEIAELSGYAGSRPVRVGNGAAGQLQLDVFGPVVQLVHELLVAGAPITFEHWQLVEQMAQAVEKRWREPDHGIWEIRGPTRHHVHSKTMCWVTIDRAQKIAGRYLGKERADWAALRDEIAADIFEHGFCESKNSFAAAYGAEDLDAAVLLTGTMGLIDPNDPRFVGTIEAIERELRTGPTVYRYHHDDGLPGFEGGFHFCTTWLVEAYAMSGRVDDAWELFSSYAKLAGPTGLIPEEYDPNTGRSLGNTPQAYSHAGLIFNALRLAELSGHA